MSLQNSHQISDVKVMLVKGADGKGISNIEKTGSEGLTDIYTITYSDGTKSTFTVTNGASGGMSAEIYIVSEEGSEVSVTSPSGRALVVEQVIGQPTHWRCLTTEFGVHTIDSVLEGDDAQVSLNVDVCKIYTVDDSHMHADIIATYPEGATCSCGKSGETPVYATTNPYTFTVHSTGTYDITIVADGQTYTDSVTVTESGQEFVVPAGSTVTPSDDVQMLLACAGVIDENITSLSDLFADSTTLSAVIASNNAVDYLARSTSFAKAQALVPTMTSDNTPSGEVIFSKETDANYPAWKAFDNDNATGWQVSFASGDYIGYDFGSATKVKKVSITNNLENSTAQARAIKGFKVQGYDTEWHDIGTFENNNNNLTNEFALNNDNSYSKYRVYVQTNWGNTYLYVMGVQFYAENGFTDNATAMSYIGLNNYASDTLLADSDWLEAICNSTYFESVLNVKVPVMTSDTTPSGQCSGSGYTTNYNYYKAFDGNSSTMWNSSETSSPKTSRLNYEFEENVTIYMFDVLFRYVGGTSERGYNFSIDAEINESWETMASIQRGVPSSASDASFLNQICHTPKKAQKFGIAVQDTLKNSNSTIFWTNIFTLQFYGRKNV